MAYSNECPVCGANLDPGEKCDCAADRKRPHKRQLDTVRVKFLDNKFYSDIISHERGFVK